MPQTGYESASGDASDLAYRNGPFMRRGLASHHSAEQCIFQARAEPLFTGGLVIEFFVQQLAHSKVNGRTDNVSPQGGAHAPSESLYSTAPLVWIGRSLV
jgi:hypothetical protein